MPMFLLLDPPNNRILQHILDPDDQLPRVLHLGCSLRDYCGGAVPEICWGDLRLLQALDLLADRTSLPFLIRSGFSLSRSLSSACGETIYLAPIWGNSLPPAFLHAALSCGFTGISSFGHWKNSVALHLINAPWVIRPGQIDCSVCFLQWALKTLGHPLPITGTLDTLTQASLHSFQMQLGLDRSDIADRSLLQILFQLTRQLQDATIQVSYGFGGKGHGL